MNTQSKVRLWNVAICLVLGLSVSSSHAFSLLGPYESWMTPTNGFQLVGDIGGPMNLGAEYRWNVPVVTYGFDQSFLDYFGTNGVAAVEGAIQILNDLPPASQIVLTNYPFGTVQLNTTAQAQNLYDLKSVTLYLLLEQMGLADPSRNIYVLTGWDPDYFNDPPPNSYIVILGVPISFERDPYYIDPGAPAYDPIYPIGTPGYITNFVTGFNFDPKTFKPIILVNNIEYAGDISFPDSGNRYIEPFAVDPMADSHSAVASLYLNIGEFYRGLTYDDVGGLAYLLSTNNVNYETLLPGISGIGTNANSFVNGAWRPGVDKITFVRVALDPLIGAMFSPMTNCYTDTYITNGNIMQQQLARVISQPDFLFSVADTGKDDFTTPWFVRTGTTNWINNATLNGNSTGAGPGIIQPPVQIIFNKLGRQLFSSGNDSDGIDYDEPQFWASFDASTNPPVSYPLPPQTGTNQMTVRMWLEVGKYPNWTTTSFEWKPASASGAQFLFQTSTNLTDWVTLFTNSNDGTITTYFVNNPASPTRFYRLVPQ